MNLQSKGVRRTLSAVCSATVVAAGGAFFASPAGAVTSKATGLSLSGATSVTTLDFGSQAAQLNESVNDPGTTAPTGDLAVPFAVAAYGYHVTSTLSSTASKLALVLDSYTAPSSITNQPTAGQAALVYGEVTAGATTIAATNVWRKITGTNTGINYFLTNPTSQAQTTDAYITATKPGTYTFRFVDTGASLAGSDDDVASPEITMTVLDAFAVTTGGANDTNDDWSPSVGVSSSALKLGAPLTATVPLTALSTTDVRSTSSGVGILAQKLGALVGFGFKASDQTSAAARDLGYTVVTDGVTNTDTSFVSASAAFVAGDVGKSFYTADEAAARTIAARVSGTQVTLSAATTASNVSQTAQFKTAHSYGIDYSGTNLPAYTPLYDNANNVYGASAVSVTIPANTIVHATTVTVGAAIDQTGTGTFLSSETPRALSTHPTAAYTSNNVSAWNWGPAEVVGSVNALTTSTVAVKVGTANVTFNATVTAPADALSGQTVYFTIQPTASTDSVSANGTLVSSNSSSGQKVYTATTDSSGVAALVVTSSATSAGKSYTIKANLNGVDATATAGTTLISTGNTTVSYAGSQPATVVDTTDGANRYPTVGAASVTLTGQLLDQFGAVAQPDSSLSQNVKVTVAGVDTYVTPSGGKFSYTYTPSSTPTAGSTTATTYTYTDAGASININDGGGLIHWVPNTAAGSVTISTPADGTSTGQTVAVGSSAPTGISVSGSVLDASKAAIPFKRVTLSSSDGVLFSSSQSGSTGISKSLDVGADSTGVWSAYLFYTKSGTVSFTAASDSATAKSTVTTTSPTDPYKVIVKDAVTTPGGTVTVSGSVMDAFGNPVPTEYVDLSLGSTGLGTLASSNPQTNSGGVFSTTFTTADATTEGSATITARLRATVNSSGAAILSSNPSANSGWATAGVTVASGAYMDQSTLTVAKAPATTLEGPTSRVGPGKVTLSGKAVPGAVVEIYAKPAGSAAALGWIDSVAADDSDGTWSAVESISGSTTFVAKTSTSTSKLLTVTVVGAMKASVKLTVTPAGKGKIRVSVNGMPNKKGTITVYVNGRTYKSVSSNAAGDATMVIKTGVGTKKIGARFTTSGYTAGAATVTVRVR